MLGTVGHLLLITSLVSCLMAGVAYYLSVSNPVQAVEWRRIGRGSWLVMTASTSIASVILSYFFFTHQFQYAYVWKESSLDLPAHFLLSAFWAGQEGSFLLWIFLMSFMGVALLRMSGSYEAPVMTVVAFCQVFLISMVVGLKFGALKIGSSPFITIWDKFPNTPLGYIPPDGSGLNDLLQNYWMAIHPPMLFAGFTSMVAPFAFAIAALWTRSYTEWVRPALPWTLFAVVMLGIGIAMGGYWAYETLSFGGYWAWDPVENSSLVPWIVGIAAIHMMIVQKKSGASHKSALFLCVAAYILVVYSTFMTRSGILGDVSVHSFVDLGLYNQLLLWILAMAIVGFGLFALRYKQLPVPEKEPEMLSREFMIFSGAILLSGVALVIFLGTSAPILGRIFRDNPSAVPIEFYNVWSIPLAIGFIFLAGMGQLFWWHKMSVEDVNRVLLKPVALAFASTIAVLIFTPFIERTATPINLAEQTASVSQGANILGGLTSFWSVYGGSILLLLLLLVTFFALYGNSMVLWRIGRGNARLVGGSVTHIGFMIMMLGIIASSGFNNPLAGSEAAGSARQNFVISLGETRNIEGYQISYRGKDYNEEGRPQYILDFVDGRGRAFTMKPVVYQSNKEQWIQNPDVKKYIEHDVFVAVSPNVMLEPQNQDEGGAESLSLSKNETVMLGNSEYKLEFQDFDVDVASDLVPDSVSIAVAARLFLTKMDTNERRELSPIYLVLEDGRQQFIQNRMGDWGITITFSGMNVNNGSANFIVEGVKVGAEDWVVVQAYVKPFISLVWIGIILLSIGFFISMARRIQDQRFALGRVKS